MTIFGRVTASESRMGAYSGPDYNTPDTPPSTLMQQPVT